MRNVVMRRDWKRHKLNCINRDKGSNEFHPALNDIHAISLKSKKNFTPFLSKLDSKILYLANSSIVLQSLPERRLLINK